MTTKNYQESLRTLNTAQREAVEAIEGPVLVLAGPGTGKTQILSTRIAFILQSDSQVLPENILCLTYTDAGRVAMKNRLSSMIGPTEAHKVNIHTFHSFCIEILQSYPDYFDIDLQQASDLDKLDVLKAVKSTIPEGHLLFTPRHKRKELKYMGDFFLHLKKENFDINKLIFDLEDFKENLCMYKSYGYDKNIKNGVRGELTVKGKEKYKTINKVIALVDLFKVYQSEMSERSLMDFEDMILWVSEALDKYPDLVFDLQEKYQYFLVDEFQDTNGAQFKLLNQLTNYEHHNSPNVFVVGDDDQAIFRFQGANMKNLLDFNTKYQANGKQIILENNYRSSQAILDTAKQLIEKNNIRLIHNMPGLTKELVAKNTELANLNQWPTVWSFENDTQEMIYVTKDIKSLIANGVASKEIAVLYKNHKEGFKMAEYLVAAGVPYHMKLKLNILKDSFGLKLLNIIRYCQVENAEFNNYSNILFEILSYDIWGNIYTAAPKMMFKYQEEKLNNYNLSFRQYLSEWHESITHTDTLQDWELQIYRAYQVLEELISNACNMNYPMFLNALVSKLKLHDYVFAHPNPIWNLEIIRKLITLGDEFYDKNPDNALGVFINNVDLLHMNDLAIHAEKLVGTEHGVQLMTCHSSKGLEFEHVYMIASESSKWSTKKRGFNGLTIPKEIFEKSESEEESGEELRRLFYVALTRAKKSVTISFSNSIAEKLQTPALFIEEVLMSNSSLKVENKILPVEEIESEEWNRIAHRNEYTLERDEIEIVKSKVENLKISVTAFSKYLECPISFYYDNLLRVPSGKSEALDFGTVVHNTLENYYKAAKSIGEHMGVEALVEIYNKEILKKTDKFADEFFEQKKTSGENLLRQYYNEITSSSTLNIDLEKKFSEKFSNELVITGKIDKIEIDEKYIDIIDYKTGKPKPTNVAAPVMSKAKIINDYWLQGMLYRYLIEKSGMYNKPVRKVMFEWIEPDDDGKYVSVEATADFEQREYLMEKIDEAWTKIKNLEFAEGCGDEGCKWCNFRKTLK